MYVWPLSLSEYSSVRKYVQYMYNVMYIKYVEEKRNIPLL